MNQFVKVTPKSEKGATIIEFALVIGLLLLLVLGIIDFSRFISAKSIMRKATQTAARQAATIDAIDILPSNGSITPAEFSEYTNSLMAVEDNAYRLSNTLVERSEPLGGSAEHRLRHLPYMTDGPVSRDVDIAIIMPGGTVARRDPAGGANGFATHPTLDVCDQACIDDYDVILRDHPIVAEMRAEIDTFIPWLGNDGTLDISVRSYAYREIPARASDITPAQTPPAACMITDEDCDPLIADTNPDRCRCVPRPPPPPPPPSSSSGTSSSSGSSGSSSGNNSGSSSGNSSSSSAVTTTTVTTTTTQCSPPSCTGFQVPDGCRCVSLGAG